MQKIISTYVYVNQKLSTALLDEIAAAGIGGIEIYCDRAHFDYRSPEMVRTLAGWVKDHSLKIHSLHSPMSRDLSPKRESGVPISISDTERLRRLDAVDEVKRALEVAEQVPFQFLVQHIGASRESADGRRLDAAFNSLEHLVVFAKQRGVTIALENTPGELASPATLRHFIADTRLDLKLCFDTGHAHMEDGVESSFDIMRDLVATTHVHDNHGERDEHLPPFDGTIDWDSALKDFANAPAANNALPLLLELKDSAVGHKPLERATQVFAKFDELAERTAATAGQ